MSDVERYVLKSGVWEITTEHGTRQILDIDEGLWMRLPRPDSRNPYGTDSRWQRLAEFAAVPLVAESFKSVLIDRPLRIWISRGEWWTTSRARSVRQLADDQVPPPDALSIAARVRSDDPSRVARYEILGGNIALSGDGATVPDAVSNYVGELERWLAGDGVLAKSRLARFYSSHANEAGGLRAYVEAVLGDEIARLCADGSSDE